MLAYGEAATRESGMSIDIPGTGLDPVTTKETRMHEFEF
jgi:hypothetical protein